MPLPGSGAEPRRSAHHGSLNEMDSDGQSPCAFRDEDQVLEFQAHRDHGPAQFGDVVFVRTPDLLDEFVHPQAFEHSRYLAGGLVGQVRTKVGVAEAPDGVFPADDRLEQLHLLRGEEVESAVRASRVLHLLAQLADGLDGDGGIVQARQEVEVSTVGRDGQLPEVMEAVEALLQRCQLVRGGTVAMHYRAVVAEPTGVIGRGFDAQDEADLIVHLDGTGAHMMFDPGPLDTSLEVVPDFLGVVGGEFISASQKGRHLGGLARLDGRMHQGLINGLQLCLSVEDDVGRVLAPGPDSIDTTNRGS